MQCDYCGVEILGRPIQIEIQQDDLNEETTLMAGDLYFCSRDCHIAYMEEAGVPMSEEMAEDEMEDEEVLWSDQARYV